MFLMALKQKGCSRKKHLMKCGVNKRLFLIKKHHWVYAGGDIMTLQKNINFVFHVGDDPGNSSTLRIYPEQNIGIIILSNAYYAEHIVWNNLPDDIINLFKDEWKVK